jgi:hypothetical protein
MVCQRFAVVDIEIVHYQMNGPDTGVLPGQFTTHLRELAAATVGGGEGEVTPGFGLDRAEYIDRATALVFVIPSGLASGDRGTGGTHVGMQRHGLLVQTHHRLCGIVESFVGRQDVRSRPSGVSVNPLRMNRSSSRYNSKGLPVSGLTRTSRMKAIGSRFHRAMAVPLPLRLLMPIASNSSGRLCDALGAD